MSSFVKDTYSRPNNPGVDDGNYERLWHEVFIQALLDLKSTVYTCDSFYAKRDAYDWINNCGKDFRLICLICGYDHKIIVKELKPVLAEQKELIDNIWGKYTDLGVEATALRRERHILKVSRKTYVKKNETPPQDLMDKISSSTRLYNLFYSLL